MDTPDFILYLGLRADADERAIRKAYARQLKEIDQETQADQFQVLRQAYNAALYWAAEKQRVHQDTASADAEHKPEAAEPAIEQPNTVAPDTEENVEPRPSTEHQRRTQQEQLHQSEQKARATLDALGQQLQARPPQSNDEAHRLISQALDTPSLVDMDAHFFFEWGIASWLANGWLPGHEHLFPSAAHIFKWREERARLYGYGRAGYIVDAALAELEMYDAQPWEARPPQRDLIRQLRTNDRPSHRKLIKSMAMVESLAANYPNWLHLITNTANIGQWRAWHAQAPAYVRWTTRKPNTTIVVAQNPQTIVITWARIGWFVALVVTIITLGKLSEPRPTSPQGNTYSSPYNTNTRKLPILGDTRTTLSHTPDVLSNLTETFDANRQKTPATSNSPNASPQRSYGLAVRNAVLPNINFAENVEGNPVAEVTLQLRPDGHITSRALTKTSGVPGWDNAVLRAIDRTGRLPTDEQGRVPATMIISFSPKV